MNEYGPSHEVEKDGVFYQNGKANKALNKNWMEFIWNNLIWKQNNVLLK